MGKKATQYYKGEKVMISLDDKLREVSPIQVAGGAHLQLVKHRESGKLILSETFYYEALETAPPEPVEDFSPPPPVEPIDPSGSSETETEED